MKSQPYTKIFKVSSSRCRLLLCWCSRPILKLPFRWMTSWWRPRLYRQLVVYLMAPRSKQWVQKGGMSTAYSASSSNKDKVFYALATTTTIGHRQRCKFLEKGFFKRLLLFWRLCPSLLTGHPEPCGFLSGNVRSSIPGTRGNMLHLFTLCRGALFSHEGSPANWSSGILTPHFRGVKPGLRFQTIHRASPHTMCPPITATQTHLLYSTTIICRDNKGPRAAHHRHQHPWELRDPTHGHVVAQDLQHMPLAVRWHTAGKRSQMISPSHLRPHGIALFMAQELWR